MAMVMVTVMVMVMVMVTYLLYFLFPGQSVHLQSTHLQGSPFLPQPQSDHCDDDD